MRRCGFAGLIAALAVAALAVGSGEAAPSASTPTVPCSRSIDSVPSGRSGGYRVVLRVVSVPRAFMPQVVRTRAQKWPYATKAGLVVHGGSTPVTVIVPTRWRDRAAIEWGNTGPVSALRIAWCGTDQEKPWNAYAGAFYLRSRSACLPLIFRAGKRSATVRFGLGQRC